MLRLTCVVLFSAAVGSAAVQNGVVRSGGQPIPGATVIAECGSDKITTVTDLDGRFEMGGLPATPCKFSIAMFGFEPAQREATASDNVLTFDLQLQTHATLPVQSAPVQPTPPPLTQNRTAPSTAPTAQPAPAAPAPSTAAAQSPGPGRGGRGGGGGRGGRGPLTAGNGQPANAQGAPGGFQSLSLQQDSAAPADSDAAPLGGIGADAASSANDAFQINGSVARM